MRLKSALEDFEANTLGAVPGLLGRLSYVSRLQDGSGTYAHWGLAKVYGDDTAQGAIRASHRVLFSEVLKKPLTALLEDVSASCSGADLSEKDLLTSPALMNSSPTSLSPASLAHFRSVLEALSALVESGSTASPRVASQLRQPGQEPLPPADT
jgi:hypothetical protein